NENNFETAKKYYDKFMTKFKDTKLGSEAAYFQAKSLVKLDQPLAARNHLESAIKEFSTSKTAWKFNHLIAEIHYQQGKFSESLLEYRKLQKQNLPQQESFDVHMGIAYCYFEMKEYPQA